MEFGCHASAVTGENPRGEQKQQKGGRKGAMGKAYMYSSLNRRDKVD